ncbi:MAG: LytTR family DNA-binding domain-containing protein [Desulfobacula sp.]|nr:LytTR family DNA-binding domain-containing protein [Desulfobacula sp.]
MNNIKTILIDDEKKAINLLKELLEEFEDIKIIATAQGVDDALALVLDHKPDLIFLDVHMPKKNGFELLHELKHFDCDPAVIFVTAYDEYAISATRHAALDYFLKSTDLKEVKKAIDRLRFSLANGKIGSNKLADISLKPKKIKFPMRSRTVFLEPEEIIYVQAEGNYSELFLTGHRQQMSSLYLSEVLKKLPSECFLRISRSLAINLKYLTGLDRKKRICSLKAGGEEYEFKVPVRYLKAMEESFGVN